MQLSRLEFEDRYAKNDLRIALIGMSNIGKSFTGQRLAQSFNFNLLEVDKIIWENLGKGSMADFAAWQGQPYSKGYAEREAKSITLETEATDAALVQNDGNTILDTTGSVIYTSRETQERLSKDWYVVHISATDKDIERLKAQYFENPKPLIWRSHFNQTKNESDKDAVLRCYPDLLASRALDYAKLADKEISSNIILNPELSTQDIFERLKPTL